MLGCGFEVLKQQKGTMFWAFGRRERVKVTLQNSAGKTSLRGTGATATQLIYCTSQDGLGRSFQSDVVGINNRDLTEKVGNGAVQISPPHPLPSTAPAQQRYSYGSARVV